MPSTTLSFMIDFLQDNALSIVSSMRPRPPFQSITFLEIVESPLLTLPQPLPRMLHWIISSVASNIKNSFDPCVLFPMSHYLGSIAIFSSPRKSTYQIFSLQNLNHLRSGGTSLPQTPSSKITTRPCQPSASPPPFLIYTDGSCPDQFHISPQNPAGWGVYFESIFLDLYGPVGSLPFQVNGSNNTADLQAPLEAIAFMLLHPPLPPHVILHLDSQYVLDLLLGLSLPSSNFELAILVLDFYDYLSSQTCAELRKVKSHTGIPGNDRADLNANKGLSSHTSIGRCATFPNHLSYHLLFR